MGGSQSLLWVHYIPILTTLIAAVFSALLFRRYFQRGGPHLLWWALGVACYGLGTLLEASITLSGNSVFLTKAWYIAGAIMGGYPLAQGSLYLLYSRRFANRATALSLPFVALASLLVILSPVALEHLEPGRPGAGLLVWQWVRLLTPFINGYAAFFLIGGAVASAWRFHRRRDAGHRAVGNSLIAAGALLPGIGGTMAKAGLIEALYIGEFIGLILIWIGERVCSGPRAASQGAARAASLRGAMARQSGLLLIATALLAAQPLLAGEIAGVVTDTTGAALPAARVVAFDLATGRQASTITDAAGRFELKDLPAGSFRISVSFERFSDGIQVVNLSSDQDRITVAARLQPAAVQETVTVTATRNARDARLVPLRTDELSSDKLAAQAPLSTGSALVQAPGITPVGSGPLLERPRLRGLDSTRLLVLVDGQRLNHARTATDRAGTEVSLVDLNAIESIEVVGGAGSVLYGTDALAGTINIITLRPQLTDNLRFSFGLDGYYSSNEDGRRGTTTFGVSHRRFAFQVQGTLESYGDYSAGRNWREDTHPLFERGVLEQADTIDDSFGFDFNAFPDPFNAPFSRTSPVIPGSAARGNSLSAAGVVALTAGQTLRVKYLRRRMDNVGFPDLEPPAFFQRVYLPYNNLDRISAQYEVRQLAPWLAAVRVSAYLQEQNRLLRNEFPVQFPVPSAQLFPINVYRLDIRSDTQQNVRTPGFDAQATMIFGGSHIVTAGAMLYRDRSEDARTNVTRMSLVGNVALGERGPVANVLDTPVPIGPASTSHPVRVPRASFSNAGVFLQDEWHLSDAFQIVAGMRLDRYRVRTDPTPGYDVGSVVEGADPPIDPDSLPAASGDRIARRAFTGDVGLVYRPGSRIGLYARYGRSYRHPNLEELLFSGPATVGSIAPNLKVKPEVGNNVDLGIRVRGEHSSASLAYFHNTYHGFISTEVVAATPQGALSQAVNFSNVRIQGIEGDGELPVATRAGVFTFFGNAAWTRGNVLSGVNPLTGSSLAGTPQDNISPFKMLAGARFSDPRDRFWMEYGARVQAEVDRVAATLLESPYLIAQDLLALEGFAVHRLAWGIHFRREGLRLGLVFAIENVTDRFYREQFQFAPARGRSFTVGLRVRGF